MSQQLSGRLLCESGPNAGDAGGYKMRMQHEDGVPAFAAFGFQNDDDVDYVVG